MMQSLFGFLVSYIPSASRDPKEDYLTQVFAWLLSHDDDYARRYVAFLAEKGQLPIDAAEIACCRTEIATQVSIGSHAQDDAGRIDLLIRVNDTLGFICEHKVYSCLSQNQIAKYMQQASKIGLTHACSVLLTYSESQHTEHADVSIVWRDIRAFTETVIQQRHGTGCLLLEQLVAYLEESGIGRSNYMNLNLITNYHKVLAIPDQLQILFSQIVESSIDWMKECPNLRDFSEGTLQPYVKDGRQKEQWGRVGIDFFTEWQPGLFAGVIVNPRDHQIPPAEPDKGLEFVVIIDGIPRTTGNAHQTRSLRRERLHAVMAEAEEAGYNCDYITGNGNAYRFSIIRKPLCDILQHAADEVAQYQALKAEVLCGVNLLAQL